MAVLSPRPVVGGVPVGGVPGEEDPADLVLVGEDPFEDPVADLVHLRFEVGQLEQFPQPGHDRLFVEAVGIVRAEGEVDDELFRMLAPGRSHRGHGAAVPRAGPFRVDQPGDQHVVFPVLRQIRGEMGADHVQDPGRAFQRHPQFGSDGLAAVRGDQVLGVDGVGLLRVPVEDDRIDAVVVLGERDQFPVEVDRARCAPLGVRAQQRLEPHLRVVARQARAVVGVLVLEAPASEGVEGEQGAAVEFAVAAQGGHPAGLAHVLRRRADLVDRVRDAVLPEHLHGALVEVVRLRQRRGAGVPLDEMVVDAVLGQQDRGGQAAAAAADDEYGNGDVRHGACSWKLW